MVLTSAQLDTPVGPLALAATARGLRAVSFAPLADLRAELLAAHPGVTWHEAPDPLGAVGALAAYLAGDLRAIDAVPTDVPGTPFQHEVWAALRAIPVGRTTSYAAIAAALGRPAAVRAVGAANGANPVAIVVPCHRVVARSGKLHGYGGGLPRKAWLLRHERALLA
jgi:methylated-DNA-[protein]-cysteine S-methyltransferase